MPLIALVYPSQDEALIKGRVVGPPWNTPEEARAELARELKAARDRGVATDLAGYLVEVDGDWRVQKVTRATRATNGGVHSNPSTRDAVSWSALVEKAKAHLAQLAAKASQEDAVKAVLAASGMERKQLRTLVDEVAPAPEQPARTAAQLVRAAEVKAMRRWDTAVAEDFPSLTQSSVEEVAAEAARQAGPDADAEKLDEALRAKAEELADVQKLVHDHVVKVGTTAAVGHVSTLLEQDGSWAGQQAGRLLKEMLRQCPECPGPHKLPKQLEAELPDPAPRTPREQIPLAFERLAWADAQRAQTQRAEKQRAPVPPEEPGPDRSDVERRRTARPEVQMEQGVFRAPARGEWKEKAEPEKVSARDLADERQRKVMGEEEERSRQERAALEKAGEKGFGREPEKNRVKAGVREAGPLPDDVRAEHQQEIDAARRVEREARGKAEPVATFAWKHHVVERPEDVDDILWGQFWHQLHEAQPKDKAELDRLTTAWLQRHRERVAKHKGSPSAAPHPADQAREKQPDTPEQAKQPDTPEQAKLAGIVGGLLGHEAWPQGGGPYRDWPGLYDICERARPIGLAHRKRLGGKVPRDLDDLERMAAGLASLQAAADHPERKTLRQLADEKERAGQEVRESLAWFAPIGPQPADIPDKAWAIVAAVLTRAKPETQAEADEIRDGLLVRVREELAKRKGAAKD